MPYGCTTPKNFNFTSNKIAINMKTFHGRVSAALAPSKHPVLLLTTQGRVCPLAYSDSVPTIMKGSRKNLRICMSALDEGQDAVVMPNGGMELGKDFPFERVLVTGATGATGASVVKQLCDAGANVKALSRDVEKATRVLSGTGVQAIVQGDLFDMEQTRRAVKDCDAIVVCSGPTSRMDPLSPFKVDFQGMENIVAAASSGKVKKIVLVSSIGTDDPLFPLNLFGAVLIMKKFGELALQRSNIDYTIIRPGGLLNEERQGNNAATSKPKNVVVGGADTFGLPPRKAPGSILRSKVAEACIAALIEPSASNKTIEMISEQGAPYKPWNELFDQIP